MQMTEILAQMGGLQSMARELGVSESQASQGADALLPALLGGFMKQAQPAGGGGGLGALLGQLGGSGLLDDVLSELDGDRRRSLAHMLERGLQTVVTATAAAALPIEPAQALAVTPGQVR